MNGLQPDLVVVTGDFVTSPILASRPRDNPAARVIEPCAQLVPR